FSRLTARWTTQSDRIEDLQALVAFNQIAVECEKEGLSAVAEIASAWESAGASLFFLYERSRLSGLLDVAFRERPPLASFDGDRHAQTVDRFRRLDLLQLDFNRALISARHAQSLPTGGASGEI